MKKSELGDLLKQWRGVRGRSQLDISADTGISQRQISFIESGRSVPSRPTLIGIAQVLEIPLRERNALLPKPRRTIHQTGRPMARARSTMKNIWPCARF